MWTAFCYACQIFWTFMFCRKSVRENPFLLSCLLCFLPNLGATPADKDGGVIYTILTRTVLKAPYPSSISRLLAPHCVTVLEGQLDKGLQSILGYYVFIVSPHNSLVLLPQNQSKDRQNLHTLSNSSFVQWWSAFRVYAKQVSTHCFSQASTFA